MIETSFYRSQARGAAVRAGIDPDIFERQIDQESGFNPNAGPSSAGACGIAQIVPESHPGVNAWDPIESLNYAAAVVAVKLQTYNGSYALALASYNAGSGNVQTWNWVPPFKETQSYLDIILGRDWPTKERHMFVPSTPDEIQIQDWTCSVRSATWVLKSIEIVTDAAEMQDLMEKAGVVQNGIGLLDGSGSVLMAFLRNTWGLDAQVNASITFDELLALAGTRPIMIGGRAWNHWTAVRGVNADGSLALANPAPGWMGVSNALSRPDFDRLGQFSAVWINSRDESASLGVVRVEHTFQVSGTGGQGLKVRSGPSRDTAELEPALPEGSTVHGDERAWRKITTDDGRIGYVANEFLQQVS